MQLHGEMCNYMVKCVLDEIHVTMIVKYALNCEHAYYK